MRMRFLRWSVAAAEAGAGLGLVDAVIAMGRHGERLPNVAERLRFALTLAGTTSFLLSVLAALACALTALLRRLPERARPAIVQGAAIALGLATGFATFSGTAMRRSPARPWAILATAALAALIAQQLWRKRWVMPILLDRYRTSARMGLLAASVVLYLVHAFVLVRLYPGLHLLAAGASAAALVGALALGGSGSGPRHARVFAASMALGALGGASLLSTQSHRALARQRAPVGAYVVRVLAALAPRAHVGALVRDDRHLHGRRLGLRDTDVVLITVDALRADRLGAYGGPTGLTPVMDAMAARGAVFERAYCTTPHTSYSLASLMTGKYFHEVSRLGPPLRPHETLAGLLRGAGFATAGFYPPAIWSVDAVRLGDLRARTFDFEFVREGYRDAGARVRDVEEFLEGQPSGRRVFVWVHFFEPHEPYERHPSGRYTGVEGPRGAYDEEVAAVDDALGALRTLFARRGRRALFVLTADHGEEFGEHGGRFHGTTLYDEQARVPLVIEGSSVPAARVPVAVSLVDLLPTLLSGLGLPRPPRLRGRDLGPLIYGERPVLAIYGSAASERMIVEGDDKLMCDVAEGSCELYDLSRDPLERTNLVDVRVARALELRALLEGWQGSHGRFESEHGTEREIPPALERALQGDVSSAPELSALLATASGPLARRALRALADLGARDRSVRDAIAVLASRAEPDIAQEAGVALALLGDPRGERAALATLTSTELSQARRAALGLARLHRREGVPVLAAWLRDDSAPDVERDRALEALEALRDPRALDALVALLGDARLSPVAARALGSLGDTRARGPLEHVLATTRYALTRQRALLALAALRAPSARYRLAALLAADPESLSDPFEVCAALGEPGVALRGVVSGARIEGARGQRLVLRGPRSAGAVTVLLRVEATVATRLWVEGVAVALPAGRADLRVPLRAVGTTLWLRAETPVDLRALLLVPAARH